MNKELADTRLLHDKSLLRTPAMQAMLIQLCSFPVVLGIAYAMPLLTELQLTVAVAALLQGAIAAFGSCLCGLALWWLAIQSVFPIALVAMLSLQLPPVVFLVSFIALVGLYWSVFRTQVPFYPSGPAVWQTVCGLLPKGRSIRFVDVGSGLGGLVLHLSQTRKESTFVGIEIAPLPWLVSLLRSRFLRSGACFSLGDYDQVNFASYDVVFAYLSPAAMPALWQKANSEMRAGTLLLSYEFDIPGVAPHLKNNPADQGPHLYGWYM
jgi:hypothetical protein